MEGLQLTGASRLWLLSTPNVASEAKELNFKFC